MDGKRIQFWTVTIWATVFWFSCKPIALESYCCQDFQKDTLQEGIVYSLPKTLLKVEVPFALLREFQKINGRATATSVAPKVEVFGSIQVSSKIVPDDKYSFRLSGNRISNNFFTKANLDFTLTEEGLLRSIDTDIEDEGAVFAENLILATANIARLLPPISLLGTRGEETTYEDELLDTIKNLDRALLGTTKKEEVALIKSKIAHLKLQLNHYQENNTTYYDTLSIKHKVLLDPFKVYQQDGIYTKRFQKDGMDIYHHTIDATYLFKEVKTAVPKVALVVAKKNGSAVDHKSFFGEEPIGGIVVRNPATSQVKILLDGRPVESDLVPLAQLGNLSVLPVKVKRAGKVITEIRFHETSGALKQHKINAQSSANGTGKALTSGFEAIKETVDFLRYEKGILDLRAVRDQIMLKNELKDLERTQTDILIDELSEKEQQLLLERRILELQLALKRLEEEVNH